MKRMIFVWLIIVIAIAGIASGTVWYGEQHLPDNARSALDKYLHYRYASLPQVRWARATLPAKFQAAMSAGSFGDSNFFRATVDYRTEYKTTALKDSATLNLHPQVRFYAPDHPLPFPPTDVWCVALQFDAAPAEMVIVAKHEALYNADWFLHTLVTNQNEAMIQAMLGCNLSLK